MPVESSIRTSELFQCNCSGTQYGGPTCSIGLVTTPIIPTLFEKETRMFNISARPSSDIVVSMRGSGLRVQPTQITLTNETTYGTFQVSGDKAGYYTVQYQLFGPISDVFEMPESSPVLISMDRNVDRVNRYFQYQGTELGLVVESCCREENLVYSDCPASTKLNPVSFRSSCGWLLGRARFETQGIVFAENRNLLLPLSISGISIRYDGVGEISSGLSVIPVSFCSSCQANKGKNLTSKPLDPPDCYFYPFDSGDVEDMLKSNSLAATFMDRVAQLLPTWLSVSVPNNETDSTTFYNTDIATSLVKHEDLDNIAGCESITTKDQGLYIVLRYGRSFEISVDGESMRYRPRAPTESNPVCVAVNLCQDVDSPIYLGLPSDVQSAVRQLPALAPLDQNNWQYSIESVTLFRQTKEVVIPHMYWNTTGMYTPDMLSCDVRIETMATLSIMSDLLTIEAKYEGTVFTYFPNEQVTSPN